MLQVSKNKSNGTQSYSAHRILSPRCPPWSLGVRNNLLSIKPDPAVRGSPELNEKQSAIPHIADSASAEYCSTFPCVCVCPSAGVT